MNFNLTFQKAKEFEKNRKAAAATRYRFLNETVTDCLNDGSDIALFWAVEALEEMCYLMTKANYEITNTGHITDEMIDQAKQHPVENLVEFKRGKALAWCHNDRRPSLYKGNKGDNVCVCPVCNKVFGPIDILTKRDGLSFKEAIAALT